MNYDNRADDEAVGEQEPTAHQKYGGGRWKGRAHVNAAYHQEQVGHGIYDTDMPDSGEGMAIPAQVMRSMAEFFPANTEEATKQEGSIAAFAGIGSWAAGLSDGGE